MRRRPTSVLIGGGGGGRRRAGGVLPGEMILHPLRSIVAAQTRAFEAL